MAVRTAAETLDLIRAVTLVIYRFFTQLETLKADLDAVRTELAVGDVVPENEAIEAALKVWENSLGGQYNAYRNVIIASLPAFARLAGAPNLNDGNTALDWLQKYMVENSIEIKKRGFTKDTSATFAGSGDGLMAISSVDINGDIIDVGHVGDLTFFCDKDASQQAIAGGERFLIGGTPAGRVKPWHEGGPFNGNTYQYAYGARGISYDIGPGQKAARSGGHITAYCASRQRGNLIPNGDFEIPQTGADGDNDKWTGWLFQTGAATTLINTVDPINGTQDIIASDDFKVDAEIAASSMRTKRFYGTGLKVRTVNGGSGTVTGTLTIKIMDRDEDTTHHTLTVDLSTLTPGTKTIIQPQNFKIPAAAKLLKVQMELASLGGTAATPKVQIDDLCSGECTLVDGYMVFIMDGTTIDGDGEEEGQFRYGDSFVIQTTSTDAGILETHYFNRGLGRYVRNATAATSDWEDPTP